MLTNHTPSIRFIAALQTITGQKNLAVCVTECHNLNPTGSYGLVIPVFEEQYTGLGNPMWFGLIAANDSIWNRYSPEQTVHSVAPTPPSRPDFARQVENVVLYNAPSTFELPVYFHNNIFVVHPSHNSASCVCEKGETPVNNKLGTIEIFSHFSRVRLRKCYTMTIVYYRFCWFEMDAVKGRLVDR